MKVAIFFLALLVVAKSIPIDEKITHDDYNNSILPNTVGDNDIEHHAEINTHEEDNEHNINTVNTQENDNEHDEHNEPDEHDEHNEHDDDDDHHTIIHHEDNDHIPYTWADLGMYDNNECSTCLFFTRLISNIMEKNSTQDFIVKEADKQCHNLPIKYVGYCDKVIEHIPAIIKYLSNKETPSHICTQIHMCEDFTHDFMEQYNCRVCQNIVDEAEYIKDNNITGTQIRTFLEDHCKLINNQLQENCNNIVDSVYKDIIENISTNSDFTHICKDKYVCH